ncbi:hypothetical protein GCM10017635_09520 [Paracoccus kondratievae]|uniref:Uncharacterized protein n=2 Tax=Paracoccus kondratievae TaxID=135740 RepID=A0AAD3RT25_9RHOB|nr:hypothetical protein pkon1_p38 [Paracoccus phage vB_PkoS_Pkon1]GLK63482.1 hypothetical protein GCM10017635_09520 [Paracoccus kondratievae]
MPDNGAGGFGRPTIALCIGGASCVHQDIADALDLFTPDFVVACNDAMTVWPGSLDAVVTLHPEKLPGWRTERLARGYPDAARYLAHGDALPGWIDLVEFRFPGQSNSGSSGLFTAKAALIDLGADIAVLAGIPLTRTPHFFDADQWQAAGGYREVWAALRPEYRARIRSMSGWTAEHFGRPDGAPIRIEDHTMPKMDMIAYEPHPVSAERKRELNAQGYKVIDARFAPPAAAAEPVVKPAAELPTRTDIARMAKSEVVEWLEAHGVEAPEGTVADLRAQLAEIMFTDL